MASRAMSSRRLARYNGITGTPLYPPTTLTGLAPGGDDEGFLLSVARLDAAKRLDLVLRAVAAMRPKPCRCASSRTGRSASGWNDSQRRCGIADRVQFLGRVPDDELVRLYRSCRAVVYVPVDEDYGYAAVEAMMAGKPVLTTDDSGGVREFVRDGENGAVVAAGTGALAAALDRWWRTPGAGGHTRQCAACGPSRGSTGSASCRN